MEKLNSSIEKELDQLAKILPIALTLMILTDVVIFIYFVLK